MFIRFPAGWTDLAHPAPARQWMFVLSGRGGSLPTARPGHGDPGRCSSSRTRLLLAMRRRFLRTPSWPSSALLSPETGGGNPWQAGRFPYPTTVDGGMATSNELLPDEDQKTIRTSDGGWALMGTGIPRMSPSIPTVRRSNIRSVGWRSSFSPSR